MKTAKFFSSILLILLPFSVPAQSPDGGKMILKENWAIQSSKDIKSDAKTVSTTGFKTEGWYPTTMPTTVLAALVANNVYPDPYYGTNINNIPGTIPYPKKDMPKDSPFNVCLVVPNRV